MTLPLRDVSPGDRPGPTPVPAPVGRRRGGGVRALALATAALLAAGGLGVVVIGGGTAEAGTVGAGSFTETRPPGTALPKGCGEISTNPRLFVTADAPTGAIPTNDWWSSLLWKRNNCATSENLHAHPLAYHAETNGLGLSYTTTPAISGTATGVGEYHFPYTEDIRVGVAGLGAPVVKAADWTDWTVTADWTDGARTMRATIGHGLPFSYYRITGGNAQITAAAAPTVWANSGAMIGFTVRGHDYVAYAPTGASWTVAGTGISSTLGGKGYFSVAVLPGGADKAALAAEYGRYAHAHVTGTRMTYAYDPATGTVRTTYAFTTTPREGTETRTVVSLYPHQWRSLAGGTPITPTYVSPRGAMRTLTGVSSFTTSMRYTGVLPEVPAVGDSSGADLTTVTNHLNAELANPEGVSGQDTYWAGKGLGRAARIAEIADQLGLTTVRNAAVNAMKTRLTNWLTAGSGETGQLFYYDRNWGTLIGYPASYLSDEDLNDHHFHYGYFVAAAATVAKFDPAWAADAQYGGMVDLLIRDANNYDRADARFPYLRDFDIYAGHDWASGHAAFFAGNNQESSSEGMNFANALIQWGQATGDTAVRDAGVYIWTTQSAAISEYWFDVRDANFPSAFGHRTVGMVWGDGASYSTWFSADPEMIQGINMLPITGGHFYLGDDPAYVTANYNELVTNNGGPPTVWQDVIWEFLALGDGDRALSNFRANSTFTSEEGESKAHTFHWIRNLAALGTVDTTVTASHPLAKVFAKGGARTYVASNITAAPLTVTFSDGTKLVVPAGKTATSGALTWSGGNATGGVVVPTGPPTTTSPSPTPTSPSPSPSPTTPPGQPLSPTQYLLSGGALGGTAGAAGTVSVAAANGTHDGTPTNPQVFTATGLTGTYTGGATGFDLAVDAGTAVGNGVQARVSYDLTGDGSFDRVETYQYFATDPVIGVEHYRQTQGLKSAAGTLGNLAGGTVKVEVWNAIGGAATSLGIGNQSQLVLPYTGTAPTTTPPPTGFAANLYLQGTSQLSGTAGVAGTATVAAANGNWVGTPHNPLVYTATGVNATYSGGQTRFDLFLDSGTGVGDGTHVRVSYDLTGDGSFDRVETYHYFATDPVDGWEHYTEAKGLYSAAGTLGNLAGGTVKVEVWNAIGSTPTSLGTGNRSKVTLPYTG
ncbi:glycosyl hydrolase [Micromonospora sp. 4G57]|uniref:glucan endo-1,3-beta-D-glucosidase n=1 Tax=Micromonospora sicca TaxID=2202420 RepID=A0ABU5J6D2_9ACTN|nr:MULTISPECIES: glycosyl hydrolase [unclassified Micromonospora]MDZ5443353.1 glycosyl hydrolase [Micromonospora sp. 4G57]MDZ5488147.1 glycosyl hydrolase [Micromonospora sp. 4G53]